MSQRNGFANIQGDAAWIRLSDVIWEWFKPLNPWQVNAVKSLVSLDALADERHPLRGPGDVRNLELFVAIFPGGKARLMMSLRQLEYLRYYIKAMKLIQPTADAIERYRAAVAEIRIATEAERKRARLDSQDFSDYAENGEAKTNTEAAQEEWKVDASKLADLPLPSSKFFLFNKDFIDIVPVQLQPSDDLKRAMQNPRPFYAPAKGHLTEHVLGSGSGTASTRSTPAIAQNDIPADAKGDTVELTAEIDAEQPTLAEAEEHQDLSWTPIDERNDGSKDVDAPSGPDLLFQQAEQIYVSASHGPEVTSAAFPQGSSKPIPIGPASFLTIDFQVWEEEYGVILDVGWSACWFQKKDLGKETGIASWQEQRTGGHWIIAENQHRLNSNMKCSIDGNTARIPYVGTGDTKVLPLAQVLAGVQGLVSMLHKRNPRGSVFVLMHSCDKDLSSLRHLGLPIDDWKLDLAPDESASKGTVYVIDTSEMAACISNNSNKPKDPAFRAISRSRCSLERLASFLLKGYPALPVIVGNSGNMADAKLECFLVMVIKGVDRCCRELNGELLEKPQDKLILEGWARDPDLLEALAQQDDADCAILLHEEARRRRRMLARTSVADDQSTIDSDEGGDYELEDERLLQEYDLEYDIGGGGPEEGIGDD